MLKYSGRAAAVLLAFAGGPYQSFALEEIVTETMIVSAARIPVAENMASSAITILTRADIENSPATFLGDLLRSVPGLSIASSGTTGSQQQIRMRGAEANQLLVLIDGVRINDPAFGDEVQFETLSLNDIERIEIVRGPQSAIWGSDAIAGVINIITRGGSDGTKPLSVFARGGSFGRINLGGSAGYGGTAGFFRFSTSWLEESGSNVARSGTESDGYENLTLSSRFGLYPGSSLRLEGSFRYLNTDNQFDAVDFAGTGLPVDADRNTKTEKLYGSLRANLELLNGRVKQDLLLSYADTNIKNFADGTDNGSTFSESFALRYNLTLIPVAGHNFTIGIDHETIDFRQKGEASFFGDPNQNQEISSSGYVIDYVGALTRTFSLLASVRYDTNSDFSNVTTWRMGVNVALNDGRTRFFGNAGRAQKKPTFTERFGFFPGTFIGNPSLRPETSFGYDVGLEHRFDQHGMTLEVIYFSARLDNEISGFVFDPTTFLFTAANLTETSHREGVEIMGSIVLAEHLILAGNYTYLRSQQPDGQGGFEVELRRPRHQGSISLDWSPDNLIQINLSLDYVGQALDRFFPPFPEPAEIVTLESYLLGNVSLRYKLDERIQIRAEIQNLFDSQYEDVFGFNTPGLGAYVGIWADF